MNDDKSPAVDPWQDLRALSDLDLGVLAHRAGPSLMCMRQALPVTVNMRRSAGQETPGEWGEAFAIVARDGARLRASFPPPPDAELTALSAFLGQPRGRLMEGAQRLVDRNDELRASRDAYQRTLEQTRAHGDAAEQALLAIGGALEVVGTGKPWAEIGKAGVEAVALLNTHLKTARQGWADESAAACRARVERDKSRAEGATLTEQVASLRADVQGLEDRQDAFVTSLADWRKWAREIPIGRVSVAELAEPDQKHRERLAAHLAERGARATRAEGLLAGLQFEFATLRDAARTLLPADSTPNPATGWLADVIRSTGSTIADLRAALNKTEAQAQRDRIAARNGRISTLEAEVESLTAGLRSLREQRNDATRLGLTPPAPAAKPDPLAGLRAVLARVPELYSNLPVGDPRGVAAACNLYAAGWRADRPLAAAHRAMDWAKRQRQLAQEAFSDGVAAGMGVDDTDRAA